MFSKGWAAQKKTHSTKLLGYIVHFRNHAELVNLFEEIFIFEVYRFRSSRPPSRVIDGGSNIGLAILYFKLKYPEAYVVGFEPVSDLFELLALNVTTNQLSRVEVFNQGLSEKAGPVVMYQNSNRSTLNWSMFAQNVTSKAITCHSVLLSTIIEEDQEYALKIDVEGSEIRIVQDLVWSGKIKRISEFIIEAHPAVVKELFPAMLNQLEANGFKYDVILDSLHKDSTEVMVYAKRGG
jgi:FkbM family methyltransferase